uniref:Conserved hypothetical plastid protein n=1 Tax=Mastocarpus papillatus TaxID=31436 RepID=A0A342RZR9_9FLOR|nr:conserved hypothetical plastid protein [Mastocarpus papillatus]AOL58215.1 conserved hypothetical plastid protein [Mastocarpus papillatus]
MNLDFKHLFNKILCLPTNSTKYTFQPLIPIEWQLILISDGSFTQNLNSLKGKRIQIEVLSSSSNSKIEKKNIIREVWIKDNQENKLAFAQSLWPNNNIKGKNYNYIKLPQYQAIGQSLIELKIDTYKDIHEIYYGYCTYLENNFNYNGPIWGRKYTIYKNRQRFVTIQEIFSPQIINFFNLKTQ